MTTRTNRTSIKAQIQAWVSALPQPNAEKAASILAGHKKRTARSSSPLSGKIDQAFAEYWRMPPEQQLALQLEHMLAIAVHRYMRNLRYRLNDSWHRRYGKPKQPKMQCWHSPSAKLTMQRWKDGDANYAD